MSKNCSLEWGSPAPAHIRMVARSVLIFFLLLKARHAAEIGADGIAVIAPFFLKPWNKGEWRPLNAQPLTRSASFCLHLQ